MIPNFLVSKARRPKFEFVLRIIDLNNVPLVSGTSYVKWHLPSSTSAEHRGRTDKALIKEHKVCWDFTRTIPIRLTIDKNNHLQECAINFEVVQDYSSGGRGEKITLGFVTLNLAEYVDESDNAGPDGEEGITRRYLMQESKINSTLRVGILMKQIDGERGFVAPPLKMAAVFGGITGIIAGDQGEPDELGGKIPTMSKSRDYSELQDMYRRALAASWAAQPGELPADQCIDDIFNGGDGWDQKHHEKKSTPQLARDETASSDEMLKGRHHHRTNSSSSSRSQTTVTGKPNTPRIRHRHSRSRDINGRTAEIPSPQTELSSGSSDRGRMGFVRAREVDEFKVREDLIAWGKNGPSSY